MTVRRGHILHKEMHPFLPEEILNTSYICTDTDSAHVYCLYEWNFERFTNTDEEIPDQIEFHAKYRNEMGQIQEDLKRIIQLRHHLLCKVVAYQYINHENTTAYTFRVDYRIFAVRLVYFFFFFEIGVNRMARSEFIGSI